MLLVTKLFSSAVGTTTVVMPIDRTPMGTVRDVATLVQPSLA